MFRATHIIYDGCTLFTYKTMYSPFGSPVVRPLIIMQPLSSSISNNFRPFRSIILSHEFHCNSMLSQFAYASSNHQQYLYILLVPPLHKFKSIEITVPIIAIDIFGNETHRLAIIFCLQYRTIFRFYELQR